MRVCTTPVVPAGMPKRAAAVSGSRHTTTTAREPMPQDLSVVAYDDEVAGLFSPPLTAVRPPRTSIGRAAVELIAARLADPGRPVHRVVVSPSLRVRESTAAPRQADTRRADPSPATSDGVHHSDAEPVRVSAPRGTLPP